MAKTLFGQIKKPEKKLLVKLRAKLSEKSKNKLRLRKLIRHKSLRQGTSYQRKKILNSQITLRATSISLRVRVLKV